MKRFFRVLYAVLLSCMLLACSSGNGETEVYVRNGVRVVLNPLSETESLQEHIKGNLYNHFIKRKVNNEGEKQLGDYFQ